MASISAGDFRMGAIMLLNAEGGYPSSACIPFHITVASTINKKGGPKTSFSFAITDRYSAAACGLSYSRVMAESILMPGLMVEATVMDFTYLPLAVDGFMRTISS